MRRSAFANPLLDVLFLLVLGEFRECESVPKSVYLFTDYDFVLIRFAELSNLLFVHSNAPFKPLFMNAAMSSNEFVSADGSDMLGNGNFLVPMLCSGFMPVPKQTYIGFSEHQESLNSHFYFHFNPLSRP